VHLKRDALFLLISQRHNTRFALEQVDEKVSKNAEIVPGLKNFQLISPEKISF